MTTGVRLVDGDAGSTRRESESGCRSRVERTLVDWFGWFGLGSGIGCCLYWLPSLLGSGLLAGWWSDFLELLQGCLLVVCAHRSLPEEMGGWVRDSGPDQESTSAIG